MSILVNADTRLLVQGITGREGEFHSTAMLEYGTNIVAGMLALLFGYIALYATKGATWHRKSGMLFVFAMVTLQDENRYGLTPLRDITRRIASICQLDWFSTEIALTHEEFVVVDYVNDGIDTRVQSKAVDGVPDEVMQGIATQLVQLIKGDS